MNTTAIRVNNISKSYDNVNKAVDNVTFEISDGEVICILGESGSGKSTLLRIIGGLEDADKGTIQAFDKEITGPANNLVPGYDFINFVTQNYKMEQFRTVKDNIATPISFYSKNEKDRRVQELLKLCRLEDKAEKFPRELSGGEQQRIALAIALADEPDILLLDEPFSNLDVSLKSSIRIDVLNIIKDAEVTAVWVSHDPSDALSVADRIIVLEKGKVIQIDKPEELYHKPATKYAAKFLGPMNYITDRDGNKTGVRPEKVFLDNNGQYQGLVTHCIFQGMHYHTYVKSNISTAPILLYTEHAWKENSEITFAF